MIEICGNSKNPVIFRHQYTIVRTAAGTTFQGRVFPVTTDVLEQSVVVEGNDVKYGDLMDDRDYIGVEPEHQGEGSLITGESILFFSKQVTDSEGNPQSVEQVEVPNGLSAMRQAILLPYDLLADKQTDFSTPAHLKSVNSAFEARQAK